MHTLYKKLILALMLAVMILGTVSPALAATTTAAAETTVPETTAAEAATTAQPTTKAPETTARPAQEEAPNKAGDSLVQVVTGMPFEDGSVDVWMSGAGLYIGDGKVVSPFSCTAFSGNSDGKYLSIAAKKADLYSQIGIDLNDYDAVIKALVVYVCLPGGEYAPCHIVASDKELGLSLISYDGKAAPPASADLTEQEATKKAKVIGFAIASLEGTEDAIAAGQTKSERLTPVQPSWTIENINPSGSITCSKKPGRGFLGGVLADDTGRVYGVINAINGQEASFVTSDEVQSFIEKAMGGAVTPTDPEETEAPTQPVMPTDVDDTEIAVLTERLELAIVRAKNLDLSGYTKESIEQYQKAIQDAEALLGKAAPSKEELEGAGSALNEAKAALVEDKSEEPDKQSGGPPILPMVVGVLLIGALGALTYLMLKKKPKQEDEAEASESDKKSDQKEKAGLMNVLTKLLGVKPKNAKSDEQEEAPKKKGKKGKKSQDAPAETGDGRYGGELARQSREAEEKEAERSREEEVEEEEEQGTSVLGAGIEETTILSEHAMVNAYLTNAEGKRIDITKREFLIGKERRKVVYCISNPTVSRRHCIINSDGKDYTVTDLGSTNGTMVNGVQIEKNTPVKLGDGFRLTISDEEFTFHIGGGA